MTSNGVVCLGAGLAGLGLARVIPGTRLFEAAKHPGGHAWSHDLAGVAFDEGAHICHSKDADWLRLIFDAASDVVETPQSVVSNWWHGSWLTYPVQNHLHELGLEDRRRALIDFVRAHGAPPSEPRNYREWCLQQYGEFLTERFYAEYTRKYWRVPMEELSTDWLSGRLVPAAVDRVVAGALAPLPEQQTTFARFYYPAKGGFRAFVEPLYVGLDVTYSARAVEIDANARRVGFADGSSVHYESLASSIPLPDLVGMIKDAPSDVRDACKKLRYTQLLCVNLIIDRPDVTLNHWYYIYDEDIAAARVSIPSNLAPRSAGAGKSALQAEIFRSDREPFDADALAGDTIRDVGRLLRFSARDVTAAATVHVKHAYVIANGERPRAVHTITNWLKTRSIHTMGLFGSWQFIWSDAAFRSGETAAAAISRDIPSLINATRHT